MYGLALIEVMTLLGHLSKNTYIFNKIKIDIPNCYRYFKGTDNSNVCSLFMFKRKHEAKQESKSKRISKLQSDPSKMYPRFPVYFRPLSHHKNQESLNNPELKSKGPFMTLPNNFNHRGRIHDKEIV